MANNKDLFVRVEMVVRLSEVLEPLAAQMADSVRHMFINNALSRENIRMCLLDDLLRFDWEASGIQTLSAITTTEKGS